MLVYGYNDVLICLHLIGISVYIGIVFTGNVAPWYTKRIIPVNLSSSDQEVSSMIFRCRLTPNGKKMSSCQSKFYHQTVLLICTKSFEKTFCEVFLQEVMTERFQIFPSNDSAVFLSLKDFPWSSLQPALRWREEGTRKENSGWYGNLKTSLEVTWSVPAHVSSLETESHRCVQVHRKLNYIANCCQEKNKVAWWRENSVTSLIWWRN